MDNTYLILATLVMATVTFITRALPAVTPQKILDKPWLHRLNESLPLSVMVLLIIVSLTYPDSLINWRDPDMHLLIAQIISLLTVLLIYHITRQLLIGMVTGIAMVNLMLWIIDKI